VYRLRFIYIIISCFFSKPKDILSQFKLHFRAIPFLDTDVSRSFTHTYSSLTGLGRWHYVFSSQFKQAAIKSRWFPVTTAETITFKRSIKAWEPIQLVTEVVCWNDKCFFLKQTFLVKNEERAVAYSQGIVRSPQGHLRPPDIFKAFGVTLPSPPMPKELQAWYSMQLNDPAR
jgi:hypothetical protein